MCVCLREEKGRRGGGGQFTPLLITCIPVIVNKSLEINQTIGLFIYVGSLCVSRIKAKMEAVVQGEVSPFHVSLND